MHIIGFSHHYTKIHDQTHGRLIAVQILPDIEFRGLRRFGRMSRGLAYDTEWREKGSRFADLSNFAEIQADERLQLVFLGNHQIPFTTYRRVPEGYQPLLGGCKSRFFKKSVPYSDLLGHLFVFKFKGERLPGWAASSIKRHPERCVRIFD